MNRSVVTLILAAGASSRMGRVKALLPWGPTTVLEHLITQVQNAGLPQAVVVTGCHGDRVGPVARGAGAHTCHNADWQTGMGGSLTCGIGEARKVFAHMDGLLVLLVDQPLVTSDFLIKVTNESQKNPKAIIASSYEGLGGVPALFPRACLDELLALPPGKGAKNFIREWPGEVLLLEAGPATRDMDTEEAYKHALRSANLL